MKKQARCSWCLGVTTWTTQQAKFQGQTVWQCQRCGDKTVDEPGFQGSDEEWEDRLWRKKMEMIEKRLRDFVGKDVILRFRRLSRKPKIVHLLDHHSVTPTGTRALGYSVFHFNPHLGKLVRGGTKNKVALNQVASIQEVRIEEVKWEKLREELVLTPRK